MKESTAHYMHALLSMLDEKMAKHQDRLIREVGLSDDCSKRLASCIANDLCSSPDLLANLQTTSPLPISDRLKMFEAYEMIYLPELKKRRPSPPLPGSTSMSMEQHSFCICDELLPSLYMCVVFAADNLFDCIKRGAPSGSVARKCASFIRSNPLRALRNAVAHGNWRFAAYGAVEYWARKGSGADPCPTCKKPRQEEPLTRFEVDGQTLNFYLDLCGCSAWTALLMCEASKGHLDE